MKSKPFFTRLFTLLWVMIFLSACAVNQPQEQNKPVITVSVLPQQYFVERLVGDHFDVNVMVQPGESPESYEPSPQQMRALSNSTAYISIGVPFENAWLEKMTADNQNIVVVDSSVGITKLPLMGHDHDDDEGEGHEEEELGELDPHIWTSPRLVKIQAQNITQALITIDPENENEYEKNLEVFIKDIETLDERLTSMFSDVEQKKFMIFHPSMGYFAEDYGLTQIPIEIGGTEPSAQELAQFIKMAVEEDVHVIFVQPEFSKRSAETIAKEINGQVVELNILSLDWLNNLQTIGQTIAGSQK